MRITREIIEQAKAGTLIVPEDVDLDPIHQVRVGDRVAYCSVPWTLGGRLTFAQWLDIADQGRVVAISHTPCPPVDGPLTHEQYWSSTATVEWDNRNGVDYIKTALLRVLDKPESGKTNAR